MLTPSPEIIQLSATFAPLFSQLTFRKVLTLIYGATLTPGKRTVSAALRVMGLGEEANCGKYHRVFNAAVWSPLQASRLLLDLLVKTFLPEGGELTLCQRPNADGEGFRR